MEHHRFIVGDIVHHPRLGAGLFISYVNMYGSDTNQSALQMMRIWFPVPDGYVKFKDTDDKPALMRVTSAELQLAPATRQMVI